MLKETHPPYDGLEYTDLVNELAENSDAFEHVAVGEPLLTSDDDFKTVISAITDATKEYDDGEMTICFIGHGTGRFNAVYRKCRIYSRGALTTTM